MATTVVFDLLDALVTQIRAALPNVTVHDGFGQSDDPGDFLMVGVSDPDAEGNETAADAQQSWAGLGARSRDEQGEVTCAALSWNGDGDMAAARTAVKAITDAVENLLRADPTLGVAGLMWTGFGTSMQLDQASGDTGASVLLIFRIAYKARI